MLLLKILGEQTRPEPVPIELVFRTLVETELEIDLDVVLVVILELVLEVVLVHMSVRLLAPANLCMHLESLARLTASWSSENLKTDRTGPNTCTDKVSMMLDDDDVGASKRDRVYLILR